MSDSLSNPEFKLLNAFRDLFQGRIYKHRVSNQGDFVALHLYEDLVAVARSTKLTSGIASGQHVLTIANRRRGVKARRGDGTFGEIIPGEQPIKDSGFVVGRGQIATVEIGAEVKILAKAMIKQVDRVINDLRNQVTQFKRGGDNPICIGIVGINHASQYTSYERDREYRTSGKAGAPHPAQEAAEAERRLRDQAASDFNEFLVLRFRATNETPFPFEWVNYNATRLDYGALLARVSRDYEQRF